MATPQKSECPAWVGQIAKRSTQERANSGRTQEKLRATLTAQLALAGFAVHPLAAGGFMVCRWNLARYCPDLDSLRAFANQVGLP